MEHARTENNGNTYQWCDSELCMILDKVTGEHERFNNGNAIGPLSKALEFINNHNGWERRNVIVKMNCISAFLLKSGVDTVSP